MRVLVLGASGMIGRAIFGVLSQTTDWSVYASSRENHSSASSGANWIYGVDAINIETVESCIGRIEPDVVINCIGLTKHREEGNEPISAITLNALFPHQLALMCGKHNARLIHISTDCVFLGDRGRYQESDVPDAVDIYGRTKILGEVNYPHAVTLRTSTIGHEGGTNYGLLEWFLGQESKCQGFSKAIFSGLPSVIFAGAIRDYVIPRPDLSGLYHIGGAPINKFELLKLIASEYGKSISIDESDQLVIDRSFQSKRFSEATGFNAPEWGKMIAIMKSEKY